MFHLVDDPRLCLRRLVERENLNLAGHHKTEGSDRTPNPIDIGDDGDALPAQKMFHSNLEILPYGASLDTGKIGVDLIVEANLPVLLKSAFYRRNQRGFVVASRYVSPTGEGDDLGGKALQCFSYRLQSVRTVSFVLQAVLWTSPALIQWLRPAA